MNILIDALSARRGGVTYINNLLCDNFFDGKVKVFLLAPAGSFVNLNHPHIHIISPLLTKVIFYQDFFGINLNTFIWQKVKY